MAKTFTKPLKTIRISVVGSNTQMELADTADAPYASQALAEFEAYQTMHLHIVNEGEDPIDVLVPFHAVISVEVTTAQSEEITINDANCEETASEPVEP